MNRAEPIRDARKLKEYLSYYKKRGEYRNYVLVNLGVHTALRISDILRLGTNDVYDFKRRKVKVSCHSLRKTFGYHSWKSGTSPVVLMAIYNHSSYDVTKRYLGVEQDDQNRAYLSLLY